MIRLARGQEAITLAYRSLATFGTRFSGHHRASIPLIQNDFRISRASKLALRLILLVILESMISYRDNGEEEAGQQYCRREKPFLKYLSPGALVAHGYRAPLPWDLYFGASATLWL